MVVEAPLGLRRPLSGLAKPPVFGVAANGEDNEGRAVCDSDEMIVGRPWTEGCSDVSAKEAMSRGRLEACRFGGCCCCAAMAAEREEDDDGGDRTSFPPPS